ncbi:endochitinase-like [Amblyomma americanum]
MRTDEYVSPCWEESYGQSGTWAGPDLDAPPRGPHENLMRWMFLVLSALLTTASVALLATALLQPSGSGHHHRTHTTPHAGPPPAVQGPKGHKEGAAVQAAKNAAASNRVVVVHAPAGNFMGKQGRARNEPGARMAAPIRRKHERKEVKPEIHCVYNNKAPEYPLPFTPSDIPVGLCASAIYCCLGPTSDGTNLTFLHVDPKNGPLDLETFSSVLHSMDPTMRRHIAVGGPRLNYAHLARALRDSASRSEFVNSVMGWLNRPHLESFGFVLHIIQPEKVSKHRSLDALVLELSSKLNSRTFMLTLPLNGEVESRYFHPLTYKSVNAFIKMSHRFGTPIIGSCPNPVRGLRTHSLQKVIRDVKDKYQDRWDSDIREKTLFTVSLAGYIYWVRNGSLTGLTKGRVEKHALSGYWDICRKVDDASWNHKYIRETGCLTAWSGRNYVSSLSPKSFTFLDGTREMKGVVVFDIEKDDFKGMCGDPYPMLRALRESLTKFEEIK